MVRDTRSLSSTHCVLCVSECRETLAELSATVADGLPESTVETTTDPTVVPELLTTWGVDCVVLDETIATISCEEFRTAVHTRQPTLPVVQWSATDDRDEIDEQGAGLAERIGEKLDQQPTPDTEIDSTPSAPDQSLEDLVEADTNCEILAVLKSMVSVISGVEDSTLWLFEPSEEGLAASGSTETDSEPSPAVIAAFESGETQSSEEPDSEIDTAYPLGSVGVVSPSTDGLTALSRDRLSRLSTVAGACLEHNREYATLEQRFHRIADRNRELSKFARTVAHDLNSPLSVICGRIELSLAEPSEADIHLQAAQNAAQRVDSLITDHLQRIEATDTEAETEYVSVQTVAIRAWRIIDPTTARLQIEPQLGELEANAIRLQQLFENLIRNAIEHGSEESVGLGSVSESTDPRAVFDSDTESVTVTIKPTANGFAVCDTGPGIPEAERVDIFDSGYTTTESESGLGLHIVSEIVDAHDWSISVDESACGGARFDITTE